MKIKYLGPGESVNLADGNVQKKDEVVDYPDDFGQELLDTSKKQKFERVEDGAGGKDLDDEEAASRKVLMEMSNAKLAADCDSLEIAYPKGATKAVLVDLILKNTAPEPEA